MARRTVVELIDDLDGTPIAQGTGETVTFAVGGVNYTLDLNEDNAAGFHEVMQDYINVARKAGQEPAPSIGRHHSRPPSPSGRHGSKAKAIRDWAHEQGLQVNERGRLPTDVVRAYEAAH